MVAPKAAATKNTPNISAPAAGFHFTHAESAKASSASTKIQTQEAMKMPLASREFALTHVQPSKYPCNRNKRSPGTQVISESRMASTDILPNTYSTRENGRAR